MAGTVLLVPIESDSFRYVGGRIYFVGRTTSNYDTDLYQTNGTLTGTKIINIVSGALQTFAPHDLTVIGTTLG